MKVMDYMKVGCWIFFISALLTANAIEAQVARRPAMEKLEAQRATFLTNELELTTQEAQAFWPIYNKFKEEESSLKINHIAGKLRHLEIKGMSDKEAMDFIKEMHEFEQKQLDLKLRYMLKFTEVLPVQKVALLPAAERKFREEVVRKISSRRGR